MSASEPSPPTKPPQRTEGFPRGSGLAGFAVLATCGVGGFSVIVAIMAIDANQYAGAGSCLVAAAVSFGFLLRSLVG